MYEISSEDDFKKNRLERLKKLDKSMEGKKPHQQVSLATDFFRTELKIHSDRREWISRYRPFSGEINKLTKAIDQIRMNLTLANNQEKLIKERARLIVKYVKKTAYPLPPPKIASKEEMIAKWRAEAKRKPKFAKVYKTIRDEDDVTRLMTMNPTLHYGTARWSTKRKVIHYAQWAFIYMTFTFIGFVCLIVVLFLLFGDK